MVFKENREKKNKLIRKTQRKHTVKRVSRFDFIFIFAECVFSLILLLLLLLLLMFVLAHIADYHYHLRVCITVV